MAFTEPSMDHIAIYLKVLVFVSIISAALYFYLGGDKEPNVSVGMEDVEDDEKKRDKSEKKSKKRSSKGSSRSETKESTNATKEDAEYRTMSLKKEMDRKGPYLLSDDYEML